MYSGVETIVVILLLKEFVCSDSLCPKNRFQPGTKLRFTDRSPSNIQACAQRYLSISCCMEGYVRVHWEQFTHGTWHNFLDVRMCRELGEDDNQTAIFTCPSPGSKDSGSYRCIGTSTEGSIENAFDIDIIDCMNWNQPPWAFTPVDEVTRLDYRLSSNLSISCRAFYGNSQNIPCLQKIRWMKIAAGGLYNISGGNSSQRVYTETYSELDESTCDSVLHIDGVEKSDYGNYLCIMENSYGKTIRMIILQQYCSYIEMKSWVYYAIFISAGTVLAAVVVVTSLVLRFKPELKLFLGDMIQNVRKPNQGCLFSLTQIVTYRCIFLLHNITTDECCRFCPLEYKLRTNDGEDVQSLFEKNMWSAIKYRCKVPLPSILNNEEGEIFWKNLKRLLPKCGEHRVADEKALMLNPMKHKHPAYNAVFSC